MKLLFKQRLFSWLDSYDIYDEDGRTVYTVKGKLSFGHCLEIFDAGGSHVGTVKEEVFTFLPKFCIYMGEQCIGEIKKEFTFFKPVYDVDCFNWKVNGDFWEWDYHVEDNMGNRIMEVSKELFHMTDTYTLEITRREDALACLMIVLAIDAAKCSGGGN